MTIQQDAAYALALMDLTSLNENDTEQSILALLDSVRPEIGLPAAICVYSRFVGLVKKELVRRNWNSVKVATVTNFYDGEQSLETVLKETEQALIDGADEIDLVIPYKELTNGELRNARLYVAKSKKLCIDYKACLKVIIESGELKEPELIKKASILAIDAGADFIKTSTGKVPVNATLEATEIMLDAIKASGREVGFKAAGGVRTVCDASAYLRLAEQKLKCDSLTPAQFRFGASGLLKDIHNTLDA
jgi:deoxyribose-phosphate aldolase